MMDVTASDEDNMKSRIGDESAVGGTRSMAQGGVEQPTLRTANAIKLQDQKKTHTDDSDGDTSHHNQKKKAEMVILIYDVAKKKNIGTIIRSAVAFGVSKILVVGQKRNLKTFGHQRTRNFMQFIYFEKLEEAVKHLKDSNFEILGCEICDSAKSVVSHPFRGNTAFMFGNEGSGMNAKALKACDRFIYIPQHGHGTASLNVSVAASIILHHFAVWACYHETGREGYKFVVDEAKKVAEPHKNFRPTEKDLHRQRRIQAREAKLREEQREQHQQYQTSSTGGPSSSSSHSDEAVAQPPMKKRQVCETAVAVATVISSSSNAMK
mmetsp:Transcript_20399/g.32872  ORF Transcript_20399/g.32872 Transcript_20399/m.32872 type:complete len:323 (-) Transcript_20399:195-1163(-)